VETKDAAGKTTREDAQDFTQRYRASYDRSLTEYLGASVGGTFADDQAWRKTNGVWSDGHNRDVSGFGRLSLQTPVLTLGLAAERREQVQLAPWNPTIVTDSYTGDANWHPLDLPELQLRLSHIDSWDRPLQQRDTVVDTAQFAVRYRQPRYELRYSVAWVKAEDRLHLVDTTGVDQQAVANRNDSFLDGRISSYLSGTVATRSSFSHSGGAGGTVTRQQLAVGGLSAVVTAPAVPANDVLQPNTQLIDGNTTASAAVDLGWNLSVLGDHDAREVGGRFADIVTDVNTFYVWFDRRLTPEVGRAVAASAQVWRSDDNLRWTAVPVTSAVVGQVENRIEVSIATTRSRYLKVTLQPLPIGLTVDTSYRNLFVSELQFLLVLPIDQVPRRDTNFTASATAVAKAMLLRAPELTYDVSGTITRQTSPALTSYAVVNGLSIARKLTQTLSASARGARQDVNDGLGHTGTWQWNAALTWNPLRTAFASLNYNGSANDKDQTQHAVSLLGRADWYEGITSQVSGTASRMTQGLRTTDSGQATGTMSLSPNRYVTLSFGGLYSRSLVSDPDIGAILTQYGRADASMSLYPAPALTATGSVSRIFLGDRPTTFASFQGSFAPLRSDLQLAMNYSKTLDTEAASTTEQFVPSLRWLIRAGMTLTVSYTWLRLVSPVQTQLSKALTGSLLLVL
jgi:hypothetical protein